MSISRRNLWPVDIGRSDVIAPVSILREQASLLGEQTRNVLTARVVQGESFDDRFNYSFVLVAPALANYRYYLFSVSHGVIFYPLVIQFDDESIEVKDEEALLSSLERIFSAESTRKVINSLLAQSTG